MEALSILEKKVVELLDVLKTSRDDNARLSKENKQLLSKIEKLEGSLMNTEQESVDEREQARMFVDGLIESIDSLVMQEKNDD